MKKITLNPWSNGDDFERNGHHFEPIRKPLALSKPDRTEQIRLNKTYKNGFDSEKLFIEMTSILIMQDRLPLAILSIQKATRIQDERNLTDALLKVRYPYVDEHLIKFQVKYSAGGVSNFKIDHPERCGGSVLLKGQAGLKEDMFDIYPIVINGKTNFNELADYLKHVYKIEEIRLRLLRRQNGYVTV